MRGAARALVVVSLWAGSTAAQPLAGPSGSAPAAGVTVARPWPGATGWRDAGMVPCRGVTIGPIENARHPGRGYGSRPYERAVHEAARMGATWVSLTPFGRVLDLAPSGVERSFEAPFDDNRRAIRRAVALAHAVGLKVLIVPHLWVESGEWRALIDPGSDAGWARWASSYRAFVEDWATVAEESGADMLSVGVEQRRWVTSTHAPLYRAVIAAARSRYRGPLTYSGNWDDAVSTVIWGDLDVIGINAFYPLAEKNGATFDRLEEGGRRVAAQVRQLGETWQRPVLFAEIGYTTRTDPAIKPWEWPDTMTDVKVDEGAQADAYAALIGPLLSEPGFAGFFVWRLYADPDDTSQEAEWGFSPRGKLAELVLRDAFAARWASDPERLPGGGFLAPAAERPGFVDGPLLPAWW